MGSVKSGSGHGEVILGRSGLYLINITLTLRLQSYHVSCHAFIYHHLGLHQFVSLSIRSSNPYLFSETHSSKPARQILHSFFQPYSSRCRHASTLASLLAGHINSRSPLCHQQGHLHFLPRHFCRWRRPVPRHLLRRRHLGLQPLRRP